MSDPTLPREPQRPTPLNLIPTGPSPAAVSPEAAAAAAGPAPGVPSTTQRSFWEHLGGRPTFERLVRRFYEGVQTDDVIWPMYPADDLEGAIQRLTGFLEQYWGGPTTYSQERGHPRLRMRHQPFAIGPTARDRWLLHMRAAVDSLELAPLDDTMLWDYLERAAHAMVNTFDA